MKKGVRIERGRKVKVRPTQVLQAVPGAGEVESLVEVIQALIPLGFAAVEEALQGEVQRLVGERYQRASRPPGQVRWGRQPGSVSLLDQKVSIQVPRVRNRLGRCELPLETYARLQAPRQGDAGLLRRVFGPAAAVQRCQWHKRENVLRYLPPSQQAGWRRKLQAAYEQPTYAEAKAALEALQRELRRVNLSAAESLAEGLEETLTLHRLGLFPQLGVSLKTTNCIESLLAQVGQRTDKVDRWVNSEQKQRWVATALLDIEPRLRRIRGYRFLPQLRAALVPHQQQRKHAQEVA